MWGACEGVHFENFALFPYKLLNSEQICLIFGGSIRVQDMFHHKFYFLKEIGFFRSYSINEVSALAVPRKSALHWYVEFFLHKFNLT